MIDLFSFILTRISAVGRKIIAKNNSLHLYKGRFALNFSQIFYDLANTALKKLIMNANF